MFKGKGRAGLGPEHFSSDWDYYDYLDSLKEREDDLEIYFKEEDLYDEY